VNRRIKQTRASTWSGAASQRLRELAGENESVEDAVRVVVGRLMEGVPCPPTDLDAICSRLNIVRVVEEPLPVSAELRRSRTGFEIVYSSYSSYERRRFSIAHEIGHVIFETTGRNPPRAGREVERLCDMIATELLLPREMFANALGITPSIHHVFRLARKFQTSVAATAIRCCEIRDFSAFQVGDGRVDWVWGAMRAVPTELERFVESALNGATIDEEVVLQDKGLLRRWQVQGAPVGRQRRALFLVRPLGRFGSQGVQSGSDTIT
jgi:hypothetical protein